MNNCQMGPSCHGLQEQNARLDEFLAKGMTRDQVRAAFVEAFGDQSVLTAPLDTGFNRLAWLFPYLFGASGAALVAFAAAKWSRLHKDEESAQLDPATQDAELQARLDDELRDLD